jgi:hypothetical protein
MKKALVVLAILGAIALPASEAYAACVPSTPMFHGYGSYFACDESRGPVSAFSYQVSAPTTVNTGTEVITRTQDVGQVLISTDWANGGIVGCPAGTPARVMIVVQDSQGKGILLSLSGASADLGYAVEGAHPNDPAGIALPVPCGDLNGRPKVIGTAGTSSVNVNIQKPKIYTDCDADSVGMVVLGGATCIDAFDGVAAGATIGGIYTSTQPCGARPSTVRNAQWTKSAVVPDAAGNATIPFTKPSAGTDCTFIGTTTTVGGVEGGSINGFIQVQGGLAAPPTAEGVRAAADSGKVRLSWSTSNEVGLAGFRLIAVSKTKGQTELGSLISAKGSPFSYTAEVRLGDLKGARSIIIRSVLTDGTTVDAAPVNF